MSARAVPPRPAHGGDPEAAGGPGDWLDLSTGINPYAYPVPAIEPEAWTRLPGRAALERLIEAARACYGAPAGAGVVAAPGSEALIHLLPGLFRAGSVAVLGPTYASHAWAWRAAGHEVIDTDEIGAMPARARIVVLANPNNPDGRVIPAGALETLRVELASRDGWLIVDEAFADIAPDISAAPSAGRDGLIVLRSFGKFFGLAGLRLGFALAPAAMAEHIAARLGAWAVSGPAAMIGAGALFDAAWQEAMRARLAREAKELDLLLEGAGCAAVGGTALFRYLSNARAPALFAHLAARHIYVRRFAERPHALRVGLPGAGDRTRRLAEALAAFRARP